MAKMNNQNYQENSLGRNVDVNGFVVNCRPSVANELKVVYITKQFCENNSQLYFGNFGFVDFQRPFVFYFIRDDFHTRHGECTLTVR